MISSLDFQRLDTVPDAWRQTVSGEVYSAPFVGPSGITQLLVTKETLFAVKGGVPAKIADLANKTFDTLEGLQAKYLVKSGLFRLTRSEKIVELKRYVNGSPSSRVVPHMDLKRYDFGIGFRTLEELVFRPLAEVINPVPKNWSAEAIRDARAVLLPFDPSFTHLVLYSLTLYGVQSKQAFKLAQLARRLEPSIGIHGTYDEGKVQLFDEDGRQLEMRPYVDRKPVAKAVREIDLNNLPKEAGGSQSRATTYLIAALIAGMAIVVLIAYQRNWFSVAYAKERRL